jgi:hypothetical protein
VTRTARRIAPVALLLSCLVAGPVACEGPGARAPAAAAEAAWQPLFDGASLAGWRVDRGGASGPVEVADGRLVLGCGEPMTTIALAEPAASAFPRDDFELELVAARASGNDFFVGLTFPVPDGELTLILGGWGGSLCGLSCLDGDDAASNSTKSFRRFDRGRDYRVLVRVERGRATATVDGEPLADVDTHGQRCSLRREVEPCRPLGLATYQTEARIASLRWRRIAR